MRTSSFCTMLLILTIALAGCNLPAGEAQPATPDITMAYQTVEARLTQNATLTSVSTSTQASTPTTNLSPSPTSGTPLASATQRPPAVQPTQAVRSCDQATYGNPLDVNIPDGTRMAPGQTFTKTWRLVNNGTCPWTTDYSMALFSGEAMAAPTSVKMPKNVGPGESIDISVDLIAPQTSGTYRGNWKLRNAAGTWFGIGPSGDSAFWVEIVVSGTPVGTITVTPTQGTPYPPEPTPNVVVNGSNTMIPGDQINLDTNAINTGAGEDLALQMRENGRLQFAPLSNALFALMGRSTPSYEACTSAALGSATIRFADVSGGDYICYRTDQGLYGYIRLLSLDERNNSLGLQVFTWGQQ